MSTRALIIVGGVVGALLGNRAAIAADEAEPTPWCNVADDEKCWSDCNGNPAPPGSACYLKDHKTGEP